MKTTVLQTSDVDLDLAAKALLHRDVVAIPTETVYGLAGLVDDEVALAKIFAAKGRPTFDPLIAHIASGADPWLALCGSGLVALEHLTSHGQMVTARLVREFWPGPLTLVLPKTALVPELCTAGLDRVAVRMPAHPVAQAILRRVGHPLAAPSANRFGRVSPTDAAHVREELDGRIGWIVDGGPCAVGVESTVVAVANNGTLQLLRPGGVPVADIVAIADQPVTPATQEAGNMTAPGQLASHYAPSRPVRTLPAPWWQLRPADLARDLEHGDWILRVTLEPGDPHLEALLADRGVHVVPIDPGGTDVGVAAALFRTLRWADAQQPPQIWVEPVTRHDGLWPAIADRLARAGAPRP